ncbi:ATP-dependent DNA ligase [Paenibacillus glucanolyticus]|uniref:ATP-dependent DNA ligase n=1 Tax=Paenibacillus glucanolyticus TaxID=59843 RepID=UPI00096F917A|nr:ATP-dependent DNA ligase [Paenibacillus glucanolyticus]OMF70496.1 ATP-dependent DNA ligase [Paenibacillus glucanolyticus]
MFISPMLLETAHSPFSHSNYIFEPKIDGHRLIFSQQGGNIRLYTRHETDCTRQYPELLHPFDEDIILDGEIACTDPETGSIDFEMIMNRFQTKKKDKIQKLIGTQPVTFVVFDILRYKGKDLRKMPLMKRKEILSSIQMPNKRFGVIPFVEAAGEALFSQMEAQELEGMVGKKQNSIYESRRSASWQKVINWTYAEVFITGYRKDELGWLTSVITETGKLRPTGIIELGVPPKAKQALYGVSKSIVTGEDKNFVYLEPKIRAKVKTRNWTKNGMLRSPAFVEFILSS